MINLRRFIKPLQIAHVHREILTAYILGHDSAEIDGQLYTDICLVNDFISADRNGCTYFVQLDRKAFKIISEIA